MLHRKLLAKLGVIMINAEIVRQVRKQTEWMTKYTRSFHPQEKPAEREHDCGR